MPGRYSGPTKSALPDDWRSYLHLRHGTDGGGQGESNPTRRVHYDIDKYSSPLCNNLIKSNSRLHNLDTNYLYDGVRNSSQNRYEPSRPSATNSLFNSYRPPTDAVSTSSLSKHPNYSSNNLGYSPLPRKQQLGIGIQSKPIATRSSGYTPLRNNLNTTYSPSRSNVGTWYSLSPTTTTGARYAPAAARQQRPDTRGKYTHHSDLLRVLGLSEWGRKCIDSTENGEDEQCHNTTQKYSSGLQQETIRANENRTLKRAKPPRRHWTTRELIDKFDPQQKGYVKHEDYNHERSAFRRRQADSKASKSEHATHTIGSLRQGTSSNVTLSAWEVNDAPRNRQCSNSTNGHLPRLNKEQTDESRRQAAEARQKFEKATTAEFNLRTPRLVKRSTSAPQRRGLLPYQPIYKQDLRSDRRFLPTFPNQNMSKNSSNNIDQRHMSIPQSSQQVTRPYYLPVNNNKSVSWKDNISPTFLKIPNILDDAIVENVPQNSAPPVDSPNLIGNGSPTRISHTQRRRRARRRRSARPSSGITTTPTSIKLTPSKKINKRRAQRMVSPQNYSEGWKTDSLPSSPRKYTKRRLRRKKPSGSPTRKRKSKSLSPTLTNKEKQRISDSSTPLSKIPKPKIIKVKSTNKTNFNEDNSPRLSKSKNSTEKDKESTVEVPIETKRSNKTANDPPVGKNKTRLRSRQKHVTATVDIYSDKITEARKKLRNLLGANNTEFIPEEATESACALLSCEINRQLSPGPFGRESTDIENGGGLFAPRPDSQYPSLLSQSQPWDSSIDLDVTLSQPRFTSGIDNDLYGHKLKHQAPHAAQKKSIAMFPMVKKHSARKHHSSIKGRRRARNTSDETSGATVSHGKTFSQPILQSEKDYPTFQSEKKIPTREATSAPDPKSTTVGDPINTKAATPAPDTLVTKHKSLTSTRRSLSAFGTTRSGPDVLKHDHKPSTKPDPSVSSLNRAKSASQLQRGVDKSDVLLAIQKTGEKEVVSDKSAKSLSSLSEKDISKYEIGTPHSDVKSKITKTKSTTFKPFTSKQALAVSARDNVPSSSSSEVYTPRRAKKHHRNKTTRVMFPSQGAGVQNKTVVTPRAKTYQQMGLAPLVRSPSSENTFQFAVDLGAGISNTKSSTSGGKRKKYRKSKKSKRATVDI